MTIYLALSEVIEIHAYQIKHYGGSPGVRDLGLLESAVLRPQSGYYSDIIEEAAALWESLATNHPFIDGNKRTAYVATDCFLHLNNMPLKEEAKDRAFDFIVGSLEVGNLSFERIDAWLRENVTALPTAD